MTEPPNDCTTVAELLFELRDGGLDTTAEGAVRAHLDRCPACRAALAFDERLTNLLGLVESPVTSAGLVSRVESHVRRRRRVAAAAYATAAAVMVAGVLGVWKSWAGTRQVITESHHSAATTAANGADLTPLFDPPPVDSLDVLGRHQNGYVTALHGLGEK